MAETPRTARTLLFAPNSARVGEVVEVRATVQHTMETGYRQGAGGQPLPRDLVRRVECHFDGVLVFGADLHAAVSANPYLVFFLRAQRSGLITVTWRGDQGLLQTASRSLSVLA